MKVDLSGIFEAVGESLVVEGIVDLSPVNVWGYKPLGSAVPVKLVASNRAGVVTLNLSCSFELELECDRCLQTFDKVFSFCTEHTAVRSVSGEDDERFVVVPSGILDLEELVTTDVVLELPYSKLCKAECKGLCAQCGRNLNQTSCNCRTATADPRWAALDKI